MQDNRDMENPEILCVTTTVATAAQGEQLARAVLAARLAACVQVESGLQSFYRWQGRDCEEAEVRLTLKTLPGRRAALQAFLAAHHPYETPQFLAWTAQASPGYAAWVREQVGVGTP